jgi:predicted RND superfamily exporter protein
VIRSRSISFYRSAAVAFYGLGLIVCLIGLLRFQSDMGDVFQWLPDKTPDRDVYNDFVQRFGADDFLIVTWPRCTVADSRCDVFADALIENDQESYFERAVSGRQLVRELITRQRQSPKDIIGRFRGVYFSDDGQSTCVMVMLTDNGMNHRGASVAQVKRIAEESIGVSSDELILAGHPQVGAYGDAIVRSSIQKYVGPSCILSTVVAWICLRNFGLTMVILAISGLSAGLSIAIVMLSGAKWGGLSSVIPTLAYVLTVSGAMHLVNYSRTRSQGRLFFRVLRIGWKPCTLSALTTAAGMLSLCRSEFPAIREFGVFCACGVIASLPCQLLLIPVCLDWLKPSQLPPVDENTKSLFLDILLPRSKTIALIFLSGSAFAGFGLTYLRSDLEVERNFSSNAGVMRDIAWLENHLGPVEQTEIVVTFHDVNRDGFDRRLAIIRKVENALKRSPDVTNTLSVTAWLPGEPRGSSLKATAQRSVYRQIVQTSRTELAGTSHFRIDGDSERWRISNRFPFIGAANYQRIKSDLPKIANSIIAKEFDGEFYVKHTGVALLYNIAQEELVADLYRNFALAFAMICPLMMLVLQSIGRGLLAMIPNVCPAVIAYGLLGWLDFPIDVGMAMTACVALGIAVDDTTHFMLRYRDLENGSARGARSALRITFHQCSRAMMHTTLITGIGLTAFLFASLAAMGRFSGMLIALITIALCCDLILLPALLNMLSFNSNVLGKWKRRWLA